jgi:hypothetical protein
MGANHVHIMMKPQYCYKFRSRLTHASCEHILLTKCTISAVVVLGRKATLEKGKQVGKGKQGWGWQNQPKNRKKGEKRQNMDFKDHKALDKPL